jgi:FLVCR family MFS transporter 7
MQVNSFADFKEEFLLLWNNKDYLILFTVFSIGAGFFNAIVTLLNQIVAPFGYSNDDAGTFGAVFILAGLVGAAIIGKIMEKTKAYKTVLRVGITLYVLTTIFTLLMLFSNNFWPLTVAWGLLGMFVLPLLPVVMENCAETTYPVSEEVSMGILFTGCNILGLGFIFALQVSAFPFHKKKKNCF